MSAADRQRAGIIALVSQIKDDAPGLSLSAIGHPVREALKSAAWVTYDRGGMALDVRAIADAAWASDVGGMIRDHLDGPADDTPDHAAAMVDLNPAQRLTYARQHGFA